MKKSVLKKAEPYLWLLPAFILFGVFTFYPFLVTVFKSLFIVDSYGNLKRFVGLENYAYILKDEVFIKSIVNTIIFTLLTVPVSKILGLLLALLANKRRKTSAFYEASFAVPMAMASSVTAMIFQLLFVPSLGFINGVFGLDIQWLNDPKFALLSIAIVQIWLSTGYEFIFLLSAVRGISQDIIESASLEGATPLQMLFKIYLPLTSPTMFYLIITDISFSVMMMSLSNVLTNGGPQNSTITMMQYIYKQISGTANYTNANPAAAVFGSGIPITAAGLDVTRRLDNSMMDRLLARAGENEKTKFLRRAVQFNLDHGLEPYSLLVDSAAVCLALCPEIAKTVSGHVIVETRGEYTTGQTLFGNSGRFKKQGSFVQAAWDYDWEKLLSFLEKRVFS